MTLDEFRQSLAATEPPAQLTHALAGLWWDAKGDWKRAHESAQQDEGVEGSWVNYSETPDSTPVARHLKTADDLLSGQQKAVAEPTPRLRLRCKG